MGDQLGQHDFAGEQLQRFVVGTIAQADRVRLPQVCDDKVFVFSNNLGQHNLPEAKLSAWNWRTGQLLFVRGCSRSPEPASVRPS